jgi:hypothetical protein
MGQFGFFDADSRLAALTAKGDPLEMIARVRRKRTCLGTMQLNRIVGQSFATRPDQPEQRLQQGRGTGARQCSQTTIRQHCRLLMV